MEDWKSVGEVVGAALAALAAGYGTGRAQRRPRKEADSMAALAALKKDVREIRDAQKLSEKLSEKDRKALLAEVSRLSQTLQDAHQTQQSIFDRLLDILSRKVG